jgi:hypothetical protein
MKLASPEARNSAADSFRRSGHGVLVLVAMSAYLALSNPPPDLKRLE